MPYRVTLYSPDRHIHYDGRTPDDTGVGGGITARLSLVSALAALGHEVTACVNCDAELEFEGVHYLPLDRVSRIDCDVLLAITTGGQLSFAPLRDMPVEAGVRLLWVQGAPKPAALDVVSPDYVYVASNFLRDVCVERWGIPANRLVVCYNGLKQDLFEHAEITPVPRDPFALAYIGPPEKGLDASLRVLERLRRHDPRYHLDVFGGSALWGQHEDRPPAEPGVTYRGLLGQRALIPQLFGYEYGLALQAMEEGFGIAVQEAKRAGLVVVASRVGAFGELIRPGQDGLLIDAPHDTRAAHEHAAEAILGLAADPNRRARIRANAMRTPWSWALAARTWTAHWDHVLKRAPAPSCLTAAGAEMIELPDGRHSEATGDYCPSVYAMSPLLDRFGIRHRVLIGGYYGHGNLGDEAILHSTLEALRRRVPNITPIVASGRPDETRRRHQVDAVHDRDLHALHEAAKASNLILLGGGGLFQDYWGVDDTTFLTPQHWGLPYFNAFAALAAIHSKPFVLHAVGVGPLRSAEGVEHTRLAFERADAATVRDQESLDLLGRIGARTEHVRVAVDPAFAMQPAPATSLPGRPGTVAVALRHWRFGVESAAVEAAVAGALDRLIEVHDVSVLFVPFQLRAEDPETDDAVVAGRVRALMRRPAAATLVPAPRSPAEAQSLLAACDLVLAMRLHAAILAIAAAVPVVAIAYDPKVSATMTHVGLEDYTLDATGLSVDRLSHRLDAAYRKRDTIRSTLAATMPQRRADALSSVDPVVDLLARDPFTPRATSPAWSARLRDARAASNAADHSAPGRWARSAVKAVVPPPLRTRIRHGLGRLVGTPHGRVFRRYRRARRRAVTTRLDGVRTPGDTGLVSIVLPAYNGEAMIGAAIDSVLAQTYARFELIIVDDGSTDETPAIAREYARKDARIRVLQQAHTQLPGALSAGFRVARGEFLTWTSCDNRLKPGFLQRMVDCLARHPTWDMAYANLDVIDDRGRPLLGSAEYQSYQRPHGSEHVFLPHATDELNVRPNNYVGAAFLYRSRVAALLGAYSRFRVMAEDYDYWMRLNELMVLCHADFADPLYDYCFHAGSLTARGAELGIMERRERLMVFDDFRRDFCLSPLVWWIEGESALAADLARRARSAGHVVNDGRFQPSDLPRLWTPAVRVVATDTPASAVCPDVAGALSVLVATAAPLPTTMDAGWDLCCAVVESDLPRLDGPHRGWLGASDPEQLFAAIDIRTRSAHLAEIETEVEAAPDTELAATVVICTRRPDDRPLRAVRSALDQSLASDRYEIVVVNNDPANHTAWAAAVAGLRTEHCAGRPERLRIVMCPIPGLSAARNAGLAESRGEVICYLDDDAVAEHGWLDHLVQAFADHPEAGVIGGHIRLRIPEPRPRALRPGWETFWSHYVTAFEGYTVVRDPREYPWGANWSARRAALLRAGGFRQRYGRTGENFWGGEELVAAALIQRLGFEVAVVPGATVHHDVDPSRFTFGHVWRTLVARRRVAAQARRDLYVRPASGGGRSFLRMLMGTRRA